MAEDQEKSGNGSSSNGENAGGGQAADNKQFNILAQYIKDLSFENPNAPDSLSVQGKNPTMTVDVNVNGKRRNDEVLEVELVVEALGNSDAGTIYKLDLVYAGLFKVSGLNDQALHQFMFIHCPHLLFPYVRELVSHLTVSGGFPPLFIDPIDFAQLYQQKAHEIREEKNPQGESSDA